MQKIVRNFGEDSIHRCRDCRLVAAVLKIEKVVGVELENLEMP